MSNFVKAMDYATNFTKTENGAVAVKSTSSSLLDFYAQAGAFRPRTEQDIETAFIKAFSEDKLLGTKLAFYTRNVRGGLGERRTFRVILRYLGNFYPDIVVKNLPNILHYGRGDDLFALVGTKAENPMWDFVVSTYLQDTKNLCDGKPVTLLAKWLPSCNTSSADSRALAFKLRNKLGVSERTYRKSLSALRAYIDVVERKMSAKKWSEIKYSGVPSKAMLRYKKAFAKHDEVRFSTFITKVEKGEEKINASTLYPYDILHNMRLQETYSYRNSTFAVNNDSVAEAQWKALPNYVDGENNVIIVADTSGSMSGRPIESALGLAIYFAERNKGAFANKFMTFASKPSWVTLQGENLYDKVRCIPAICDNTNLQAAFKLILNTAKSNHLTQDDMPKSLVIITDMQFDPYVIGGKMETFFQSIKREYEANGYQLPNVVFWTVESRRDTFQVSEDEAHVQLVSGQSVSTFKTVLECIGSTPYNAMLKTLNDPMYDRVVV